jgi:hypothetical protein
MRLSYTSLVTGSLSIGVGLIVGGAVGLVLTPIQLLGNGVEMLTGSKGVKIGEPMEDILGRSTESSDNPMEREVVTPRSPKRGRRSEEPSLNGMER